MTSFPVSIGIAGIGNVGSEVVTQLTKHKEYKKSFTIKAVSYRNKKKKRIFFFQLFGNLLSIAQLILKLL